MVSRLRPGPLGGPLLHATRKPGLLLLLIEGDEGDEEGDLAKTEAGCNPAKSDKGFDPVTAANKGLDPAAPVATDDQDKLGEEEGLEPEKEEGSVPNTQEVGIDPLDEEKGPDLAKNETGFDPPAADHEKGMDRAAPAPDAEETLLIEGDAGEAAGHDPAESNNKGHDHISEVTGIPEESDAEIIKGFDLTIAKAIKGLAPAEMAGKNFSDPAYAAKTVFDPGPDAAPPAPDAQNKLLGGGDADSADDQADPDSAEKEEGFVPAVFADGGITLPTHATVQEEEDPAVPASHAAPTQEKDHADRAATAPDAQEKRFHPSFAEDTKGLAHAKMAGKNFFDGFASAHADNSGFNLALHVSDQTKGPFHTVAGEDDEDEADFPTNDEDDDNSEDDNAKEDDLGGGNKDHADDPDKADDHFDAAFHLSPLRGSKGSLQAREMKPFLWTLQIMYGDTKMKTKVFMLLIIKASLDTG